MKFRNNNNKVHQQKPPTPLTKHWLTVHTYIQWISKSHAP